MAIIERACYAVNSQAYPINLLINGIGLIATVAVTLYTARIAHQTLEANI